MSRQPFATSLPGLFLLLAAFGGYGFVAAQEPGQEAWRSIWPIFGTLCLLAAIWLFARRKR